MLVVRHWAEGKLQNHNDCESQVLTTACPSSAALNGMLYNRGTIGSSKVWADLVDDDSWSFENILPFFARGITYSPANTETRPANASVPPPANPLAFNGSGPLQVSHPNYAQVFDSYFDAAMEESGIPTQQDFSSGSLLGRQYAPVTISYPEEERSTSEAYLDRALQSGRDNLKIYPNTLARRVLFNGNLTATGVELETSLYGNSKPFHLNASKETILSAGAFQSPQLLMVSGIGPREQLGLHGIDVLAARPGVGAGMIDHLDLASMWEITIPDGGVTSEHPYGTDSVVAEYRVNRTGPLTSAPVVFLGWENLAEPYRGNLSVGARADLAKFPDDWPELE
jgi:choline dehydrogenase